MRIGKIDPSESGDIDSVPWPKSMRDRVSKLPLSTRDELNQRLRLNRFLLASAFSMLYLVVLVLFHSQGKVDLDTLVEACAIVVAVTGVLFSVFRLGLNLRFPDPSLTSLQVLAAVFTMLFVVYRAPETRLVFAAFFFVALMFGMLGSSGRQLTILGSIALASFAFVIWARYSNNHDVEMLRLDMLQLCVVAIAFPWLVFIGSRVKRLKEADRRKDVFLATLAHELRNPLAPIRTGIQILRLTGTEPSEQSVLPMMERQLQHVTRLLDDLLDVSRITRGKITLHVERIDARHSVQAAIETSRPLIEEMGHEFTARLPSEPLWVDADPVRLAQVLSNLLDNAAKYTPSGGRIALTAEHRGNEVEVRVSDNGNGIPTERLESIFDMFTQLENPVSDHRGGLGIGLSLAKGLVMLHHGKIEARSEGPGRGSEFRVRLPAGAKRLGEVDAPKKAGTVGAKLKVLIVDDNRDVAASLAMLMKLMGHEVRLAYDGETAVRLADEFRPHTMLVDIGMPGIDGYEVCRRIRHEAWGKEITLIAVTGWGQDEDRWRSASAGFDAHLVKPVNPDTLQEALSNLRSTAALQ